MTSVTGNLIACSARVWCKLRVSAQAVNLRILGIPRNASFSVGGRLSWSSTKTSNEAHAFARRILLFTLNSPWGVD